MTATGAKTTAGRLKKSLWLLAALPLAGYLALLAMLMLMQRSLLYPGVHMHAGQNLDNAAYRDQLEQSGFQLWTDSGGRIIGLKKEVDRAEQEWWIFYGNGDHALRATGWARFLESHRPRAGATNYYILEYPGYALSTGSPSEEAVIGKAMDAWNASPPRHPRFIFGQSMGAAVAARMAREYPAQARGLVLVNPYTELLDAARSYLRLNFGPLESLIPTSLLVPDRYRNRDHLSTYPGPVVIVAGAADALTPSSMAVELSGVAPGPCRLWVQEGVGHWADLEDRATWREAFDFLALRSDPTPP